MSSQCSGVQVQPVWPSEVIASRTRRSSRQAQIQPGPHTTASENLRSLALERQAAQSPFKTAPRSSELVDDGVGMSRLQRRGFSLHGAPLVLTHSLDNAMALKYKAWLDIARFILTSRCKGNHLQSYTTMDSILLEYSIQMNNGLRS